LLPLYLIESPNFLIFVSHLNHIDKRLLKKYIKCNEIATNLNTFLFEMFKFLPTGLLLFVNLFKFK
jgi:hypothetical protein